jgi:hypothetical protein
MNVIHPTKACSCSVRRLQTRDFARFGWLFLNKGKSPLTGDQLVPAQWVIDSVTPDAPHLQPGRNNLSDYPFGSFAPFRVPLHVLAYLFVYS